MCVARLRRRGIRGVTLLEIAIVVAIIGIMAGLGGTMLTELIPSWRTRRAASEFASAMNTCRQMAIAHGVEYRVRLGAYDPDVGGSGGNIGIYYVERGDAANGSASWDVLPVDMDGSDAMTGEGTVDFSAGGEDELRGVSLDQWGVISGVSGNDVVCSPRGWLINPVSDFDGNGYIRVSFVNKKARQKGDVDDWDVLVSRGGMVRMEASRTLPVGGSSGTPDASEWTASGATGHTP